VQVTHTTEEDYDVASGTNQFSYQNLNSKIKIEWKPSHLLKCLETLF